MDYYCKSKTGSFVRRSFVRSFGPVKKPSSSFSSARSRGEIDMSISPTVLPSFPFFPPLPLRSVSQLSLRQCAKVTPSSFVAVGSCRNCLQKLFLRGEEGEKEIVMKVPPSSFRASAKLVSGGTSRRRRTTKAGFTAAILRLLRGLELGRKEGKGGKGRK